MKSKKLILFIAYFSLVIFTSCGGGLEPSGPVTELPGFSGKVTFVGDWPEGIQRAHLVVFRNPLNTVGDFNPLNLAFVGDSIPIGASSYSYDSQANRLADIFEITPGDYSYTAVAISYSAEILLDRSSWYVIGVYYANSDTIAPGKFSVFEKSITKNIDIICDFNNPPPQPPE